MEEERSGAGGVLIKRGQGGETEPGCKLVGCSVAGTGDAGFDAMSGMDTKVCSL